MDIIAHTNRGKFYIDNKNENTNKTTLVADWPFFRGEIQVYKKLKFEDLKKGFSWSLKQNFIEEDSSVISTMIAQGKKDGLTLEESILQSDYLPKFLAFNRRTDYEKSGETSSYTKPFKKHFKSLSYQERRVYPIIDNLHDLETLFDVGATLIQLRIKNKSQRDIYHEVEKAVRVAQKYSNSRLIINDYWDAAIKFGAFGVHLGQGDLKTADLYKIEESGLRLGLSTHSFWEVSYALQFSPSYIACGPIYKTRVKEMPWLPQGERNLSYWVNMLPSPVVAIGGINFQNLDSVKKTGVKIISLINGIVGSARPQNAFLLYQKRWEE